MELSFWELNSFFRNRQLVAIGSGIVGLNAAIAFKQKNPSAGVLVLERGNLPMGASTKNAGFSCFGSVSELLADLKKMKKEVVLETVDMRLRGLKRLREIIGEKNLDFKLYGGFEVFDEKEKFEQCADSIGYLNKELRGITKKRETFLADTCSASSFGMRGFSNLIYTPLEGQIDTGRAMKRLLELAVSLGISVVNGIRIESLKQVRGGVVLCTDTGFELKCENVIVATNGFAAQLLPELAVKPARAQVFITQPIKNLKLKGNFHYDEGYYYFRNFYGRVLLGGGRNLNFEAEETYDFGLTGQVQNRLEELLTQRILPGRKYEIDHRWSGIMGIGSEKKPIIKKLKKNLVVAVRMGGMGVAIGSLVGELAVKKLME